MKKFPDNCIDTIITDPPYGLSFMGKKWDYDVPSIATWKECLRVLKPGGTLLCFAGSRTQHRMAINVEDAGFILKDCIMWLYGSGFPKATDISKQLDKGHERKQGKLRTDGRGASPQKLHNHGQGDTGIGHADGSKQQYYETEPATPEAELWNGWKSHGLKPAYEPILVAMKPNEGSYAQNALKYGVAGLNIDAGRIGVSVDDPNHRPNPSLSNQGEKSIFGAGGHSEDTLNSRGRFPANIILDEVAAEMLDEQSGHLKSGKMKQHIEGGRYNVYGKMYPRDVETIGDEGGASRFFYCAKASKAERNAGCEEFDYNIHADRSNLGKNTTQPCNRGSTAKQNFHPCVKPLALMDYLCKLTKTPTGGIVLDPFAGSGSTICSAIRTGRPWVAIEMDEDYVKIIKARIANATEIKEEQILEEQNNLEQFFS